jgi:hypothetical protein
MDPVQLASAAAIFLAARSGEVLAEDGLSRLRTLVRRRLAGRPQDEAALERVREAPARAEDVERLADVVGRHIAEDPDFRSELETLVGETGKDPALQPILVQLATGAEIGKLTIFSGPVRGDISF